MVMNTEYGHIQGIDLSGNLLYYWDEIMLLLEKISLLEELNLSSNILHDIVKYVSDKKNDDGSSSFQLGTKFFPPKTQQYETFDIELLINRYPFLEELNSH